MPEIAKLYNFPTQLDGSGQTVGILEFGGGYRPAEIAAYFAVAAGLPTPEVVDVSVDGNYNNPDPGHAESYGRTSIDIEIVGALAPKASIRVYFSSFTEKGFVDALNQAVADNVSIVLTGWGKTESQWEATEVRSINEALKVAAQKGVTVVAAAGDAGVTNGLKDGKRHVVFPASSPWVLSVGGTSVVAPELIRSSLKRFGTIRLAPRVEALARYLSGQTGKLLFGRCLLAKTA